MDLKFKNELKDSRQAFKLHNAEILSPVSGEKKHDAYDYYYDGAPSETMIACLRKIESDKAFCNERKGHQFFSFSKGFDEFLKSNNNSCWGLEFWKSFKKGKNIVDMSQWESTSVEIAWIASVASDVIIGKGNQLSPTSPFLVYLVPSQQEVIKVLRVCNPLKENGIHTFCPPPGASLVNQTHVLNECKPDILVSTPNRLSNLISHDAIDLSMVSFLVIDGPEYDGDSVENIKTIRNLIPSRSQTMVFGGCLIDPSPPPS